MGTDKATLVVEAHPLAQTVYRRLRTVAAPVVEVGPGVSGAPIVARETPIGDGPLAATMAGLDALGHRGYHGPILLVACDLPLVSVDLLAWLAGLPGATSVVPVVDSHPQPLCARWSVTDLNSARSALAAGERSLQPLLTRPDVRFADRAWWGSVAQETTFADVDDPCDLDRLGLHWQPGPDTRGGIGTVVDPPQ